MPRILIFEDDEMLRSMYQRKFTRENFSVSVRSNAINAVADALECKPNIILMDLIMPKIDGFDATRMLMANPATSKIPVLVVSNLGDQATIQKALWFGAKDIVVKANLTPSQLVTKVRAVLVGTPSEHVLNPQLINLLHIDTLARSQRSL